MHRALKNLGKIFVWLLVGACAAINLGILDKAIELPTLTGAGAAQADLGLYLVLMGLGIPIVIVSLMVISLTLFVRVNDAGLIGAFRYNYGICLVALLNSIVPLVILYWLLRVWKH